MSNLPQDSSADVTTVQSTRTSCDGGGGALGHPKTWLDMGQDKQVQCKYCDHVFVLDETAAHGGAH